MGFDLVTVCARYGKYHEELFLRSRKTDEPMETPRRFYLSDSQYEDGIIGSASAWEKWNSTRPDGPHSTRTPFYDILDSNLKDINGFIRAGDSESFDRGVALLQERMDAAKDAGRKIEAGGVVKEETAYYLERKEKGPEILEIILERLQKPHRTEEAVQKLAQLCNVRQQARSLSQRASRDPSEPSPSPSQPSTASSSTTISSPPKQDIYPAGEAYGVGHDPRGRRGTTQASQGDMYALSAASTHHPEPSSQSSETKLSSTQEDTVSTQATQRSQAFLGAKQEQSTSQPVQKEKIHPKGQASKSSHKPEELQVLADVSAENVAPVRKPIITSWPKRQQIYRRNSSEYSSEENPRPPSYVKTRDFAYEGA